MANKHTKGPWMVSQEKTMLVNSESKQLRQVGYQTRILDNNNCIVCDMNYDSLANANLIAAAPELLHTVKLLKIAIENCHWHSFSERSLISGSYQSMFNTLTEYGIPAITKAEKEIKND